MNFVKTFLAGLLAVIVGTFLVFFLWIFILLGIAGSMEKSVAVHPESILKIDFSEVLTDAPSSDPLAGIDLMTLQTTRQLSLFKALRHRGRRGRRPHQGHLPAHERRGRRHGFGAAGGAS